MFKFLALLFSLGSLAFSLPYKSLEDLYAYDESDEITVDEDAKTPEFLSKSLDLVVNQGDSVSLPCSVTRLQGFVLLWKKDGNILSVGDTVFGNAAARYYLQARENGNNLVISQVESEDEGEYVCQISAFRPTQIQHTVKIKVRPMIVTSPANNLTVKEGERVELDCDLMKVEKGLKVKWRRIGHQTKFETTNGYILFETAAEDQAGAYECVAEDEFGKEIASKRLDLFIEYAPTMRLHQTLIKSVDSEEVHIDCEVRGFPDPNVKWTKDNMPIRNIKERTLNGKHVKSYTLVLSKDEEHPYPEGKFSCEAKNAQGSAKESIQMQGVFDSLSESSEMRNQYPRLDIRNFYLERIEDETAPENVFDDLKENKNDKIDMKKFRVFSYSKSLKEINHLRNQVNTKHESRTPSEEFSQQTSEDLISSRAKNKAFRGSFSDDADLNEIDGLTKDQDIEETLAEEKEMSTDVGWGWYQKSFNPRLTHQNTEIKNFPNVNVDAKSEKNMIYENIPKSDYLYDLTNDDKTQGQFKSGPNDKGFSESTAVKDNLHKQFGHQSQSEPQEKRMGASLGRTSSDDMFLTTSIVRTDRGETNLENSSPYEKPFIPKHLPSDIDAIDSRLMSQENGGDFDGSSEDVDSTLTLDLLLSSLPESVGTIYKASSGNDDKHNSQTYDDGSVNHVSATETSKFQDIEYGKQKISDEDSLIYPHHESQHANEIKTSETKDSKNNKNDDFENAMQNAHFEKDELDEGGIFSNGKRYSDSIKHVDLDRENQIGKNEQTVKGVFVRIENQAVLGSSSGNVEEENYMTAIPKIYSANYKSSKEIDLEAKFSSKEFDNTDMGDSYVKDPSSNAIEQGHYMTKISEPFHKDAESKKEINPEEQYSSQENDETVEDHSNVVDTSFNNIKEEEYHIPTQSEAYNENDKSEAERDISSQEQEHMSAMSNIYDKVDESNDENDESNIENDPATHISSQESYKKDQEYYDVIDSYSSEIKEQEFITTLSNNFYDAKSINDNIIEIPMSSQELDKNDEDDNNLISSSSGTVGKEEYMATLSKSFNENDKFKSDISLEKEIPSHEFAKSNGKSDGSVDEEVHMTTISNIYNEFDKSSDENEKLDIENDPETQTSSKEYDRKDPENYEVIDSHSDEKEEEYMAALPTEINKNDGLDNEIGFETQNSTHNFHQTDEDDSYATQSSSKEYDEVDRNELDMIDSTSNIIEDKDYVAILGKAHNEKDQSNYESDLVTQISSQKHYFRGKTTTANVILPEDDKPEKDTSIERQEVQGFTNIEENRVKEEDDIGSNQLKQDADNRAIEKFEATDKSASSMKQPEDKQQNEDEKKLNDLQSSIEEEKEDESVKKDNQPDFENYVDYSYAEIAEQKKSKKSLPVVNDTSSELIIDDENLNETIIENQSQELEELPLFNLLHSEDESQTGRVQYEIAHAKEAVINRTPLNASPHSLQIEWTAESETPITLFRVQFMKETDSDWSEIGVKPANISAPFWHGEVFLTSLDPATEYVVKVASENSEGYGPFSAIATFTTELLPTSSSSHLVSSLMLPAMSLIIKNMLTKSFY